MSPALISTMAIQDPGDVVWGTFYKSPYINPAALPAYHKWKYQSRMGLSMVAIGLMLAAFCLFFYSFTDLWDKGWYTSLICTFSLTLSVFVCLFGCFSLSIAHELEITETRVTYSIRSFFNSKSYQEELSSFKGIFVLAIDRYKVMSGNDYGTPETVYTVYLYHLRHPDLKIPLYEAQTKQMAYVKAERYATLMHLPILDDSIDPVGFSG